MRLFTACSQQACSDGCGLNRSALENFEKFSAPDQVFGNLMRPAGMRLDSDVWSSTQSLDPRHVSRILTANVDSEFSAPVPFAQQLLQIEIFPHPRMRELHKKVKRRSPLFQLSPVTASDRQENGPSHRRRERVNPVDGKQMTKKHRGKSPS